MAHVPDLDPSATPIHQGPKSNPDDGIAIIGMSCRVAGADDLEAFWTILCEGKSQHIEVPEERFGTETQWRDVDKTRTWYGNFINDHDAYDHKFFNKSPREAASTDPQHRLLMQCAYQAVEQSGYFRQPRPDTNIGVYVGADATDYENNVACYPANAFTAIGNLRAFIAGKISHYFGWTGPGFVINTACSSSGVAIHQACRAILTGECSAALVGGVSLLNNIIWFQNLAAASFLSPTGQCKPWDEKADGYCRGEAVACVLLKKMSTAIADGNQILGCVHSTSVTQNENCTPVFVPNSPSISYLLKNVIHKTKMEAQDITVVEAHGTGTAVGDPVEYASIREVLGGPIRDQALSLGSLKGTIGHPESASGIVSLIKTVLMIQEGLIPPQTGFDTLSHRIDASATDMMEIPTKLKPWIAEFKAALVNNYGASGSNASMVVSQPFHHSSQDDTAHHPIHSGSTKHPFWICGLDDRSLHDYCIKLLGFIKSRNISAGKVSISNLSFNICRQSNRALKRGLIFSSSTMQDVEDKLTAFTRRDKSIPSIGALKIPPPVILCFGGQISTFIGLDRNVYDGVKIFRYHLDQCNDTFLSIGLDSIYPDIFQRSPIEDTVSLQTMLFAVQYASAKSWISCGVEISAVIGHSFGELTALCVSGILSLEDAVKLIAGRAKLVRDSWGSDRGSMMAIDADLEVVHKLLTETNAKYADDAQVAIACYNGQRTFTLAGSTKAIEDIADIAASPGFLSCTRAKKINVTNAFHSALVDPLVEGLKEIGHGLTFGKAVIQLERSTEQSCSDISSEFVAEHMRNPVYFSHAVQRLAGQYPSAIWLEAGSNSTITTMANRALGSPSESCFQGINITSDNGLQHLTDATIALWKAGLKTEYWSHHALQTSEYGHLFLPPYQFEKVKHWMDLKKPLKTVVQPGESPIIADDEPPTGLWTFLGYQDKEQRLARFRINTSTKKYIDLTAGRLALRAAPVCSTALAVDMTIEALMSIRPDFAAAGMHPITQDMESKSPICADTSLFIWMQFEALDAECHSWSWKIISHLTEKPKSETEHMHGKLIFRSIHDPKYEAEFAKYERLARHERCLRILNSDDDTDEIIKGRNIYKAFSGILELGEQSRGLKRIVGRANESAGCVVQKYNGETWLDSQLSDCFDIVGGIWVNCMANTRPENVYVTNGFELMMRSPKVLNDSPRPEMWHVYACHHQRSEKEYVTDIFTFDGTNGQLMEVTLGIKFASISKVSMQKVLDRLVSGTAKTTPPKVPNSSVSDKAISTGAFPIEPVDEFKPQKAKKEKKQKSSKREIESSLKRIISDVTGCDAENIKEETELASIGIDSLVGMELARDIEISLECCVSAAELSQVFDFLSLVDYIKTILPPTKGGTLEEQEDDRARDSFEGDISSKSSNSMSTRLSSVEDIDVDDSKPNDNTLH